MCRELMQCTGIKVHKMEYRKKIHPSVLYRNVWESAKDKQQLNVKLVH